MDAKTNWAKKFAGTTTAIVTPFESDGKVDYKALKNLIEYNISGGVSGIVVMGTTGESPTLDHEEHQKVIKFVIDEVKKRVNVIAGTGSNATSEAIKLTEFAKKAGADAALLMNPYYNTPTQQGQYLHFKAVADSTKIPILIYNIQGRTGVNLETPTLLRLINDCENIVGVKEASGNIEQIKSVIEVAPENFCVLSGDDKLTLDVIKAGGDGIISVASNIVPDRISKMTKAALEGKIKEAEEMNKELIPLYGACFYETNPLPIKFMLAQKGMCKEIYRLPMCEMMPESKKRVLEVMKQTKLL
ncbi:MAG: 4-hydroxy-tetrahydrodipicolinate synthase [archaeon]